MLQITSLNSGSNGNCYYIGNGNEAVLIDAGISCRETEKRMARLGLSMSSVKAIIVSHEHSDHITGVPGLSKKFRLPVYITPLTLAGARIPIEPELIYSFITGTPLLIGELQILPFAKKHDAADPHSFVISYNNIHVGVFTDIGNCCAEVIRYFKQCHAVFLESNYCSNMLAKGNYPWPLKERIRNGRGHLSNTEALDLFRQHRGSISHLILSHLSRNNNDPELVDRLFREHAEKTTIVVASRYKETEVYCIDGGDQFKTILRPSVVMAKKTIKPQQLSLF